jgi:hypothetical protein
MGKMIVSYDGCFLIKLPVMGLTYKLSEEGKIDLDTGYTKEDGKHSDNAVFMSMRKFLGDEEIQGYIDSLGMKDTDLKSNETSAYDMGLILTKLWKGELMNTSNRDEMLSFLTDTDFENWIRAGIPEEVVVSHKYGRETHIINDAGIILAEKEPFVLVILSEGIIDSEANEVIPQISSVVWDFVGK